MLIATVYGRDGAYRITRVFHHAWSDASVACARYVRLCAVFGLTVRVDSARGAITRDGLRRIA